MSVDDLLDELRDRAAEVNENHERLDGLLDAVMAVSADLDLPSVLERIVTIASRLVDARYGALGVLGPDGRLEQFVTTGLTAEQIAAIGPLPKGHGVLGALITDPEPLRLTALGDHPQSYGFPTGHPPMSTFLGVPIRLRESIFGNLYLTDKRGGGEFTVEDEAVVVALAAAASIAVNNARSYERSERRHAWLNAAASSAARFLTVGTDARDAAQAAVAEARALETADVACLFVDEGNGLRIEATSCSPRYARAGLPVPGSASGLPQQVRAIGNIDPARLGWSVSTAVLVPAWPGERMAAVLALGWIDAPHGAEVPDPTSRQFLEQVVLAREAAAGQAIRERLAVLGDRERIAADLHDHVIQRLFAVGLSLQAVGARTVDPDVETRLESAIDDIDDTIRDLRRAIFELRDRVADRDARVGLAEILRTSADALGFRPTLSIDGQVEAVDFRIREQLLAVAREALSNAAKHARASSVGVQVEVVQDEVRLVVHDDGAGIVGPATGHRGGLENMAARALALGGSCDVHSSAGAGTRVVWRVPLRESS